MNFLHKENTLTINVYVMVFASDTDSPLLTGFLEELFSTKRKNDTSKAIQKTVLLENRVSLYYFLQGLKTKKKSKGMKAFSLRIATKYCYYHAVKICTNSDCKLNIKPYHIYANDWIVCILGVSPSLVSRWREVYSLWGA